MIEKIMKAVKSNNKKRGRNITVGAVVGMLLSCTVVMGDVKEFVELEIKEGDAGIVLVDKDGKEFTLGNSDNPYPDNNWNASTNTYTNNSVISGTNENVTVDEENIANGTGLKVSDTEINLVNNGVIKGEITGTVEGTGSTAGKISGYGIDIASDLNGTLTNNGEITGFGTTRGYGIYVTSDLNGNLTNNGKIAGTGSTFGCGIYVNSNLNGNLTNNGIIKGFDSKSSSGIFVRNLNGKLTNNGKITGFGTGNDCYGIQVGKLEGELKNNGEITASGAGDNGYSYGIRIGSSLAGSNLTNNGKITSMGAGGAASNGYGIRLDSRLTGELKNNGVVAGTSSNGKGHGIYLDNTDAADSNIINKGVVYGKNTAVTISGKKLGELTNYGLLVVGKDGTIINEINGGKVTSKNNYGLAFKVDETKYSAETGDFSNFGTISTEGEYIVVNAKAEGTGNTDITGTESLTLEKGTLSYGDLETEVISPDKKYVFNGITDTLKVSGWYNKLNDSIVNAYETAVVMGEDKSMLTLDNTVVNGGMAEDTTAVNITGTGNEFIAKGNSVINTKADGVAITVGGNNNAVVLEGNAIVNGKMEATGKDNILDLNGTGKYGMNMHYDISGFEKMAIDNNVTFSEDMKVTGTKTVAVEGTGVLNLRLKKIEDSSKANADTPKATHAFSGNGEMTIEGSSKEEAGTLNFITNGIGREILVDMEDIALKNMKIKASSIIDTARFEGNDIHLGAGSDLGGIVNPKVNKYNSLNKIYKSIYSSREENIDGLRDILSMTYLGKNYDFNNTTDEEQLANLLTYLNSIYSGTPYSYSSELSRRSVGMFRDIITENEFRPNLNNWLIMGGLTHADGGTKDTYYGRNYHEFDTGSSETSADMKLTGAYMLAKYGYSENTSLGLTLGGNKSEAKLDMAKVKGNSGYLGAFAENYRGNLTLKAGAGVQYSEYDADRRTTGDSYSDKYSDMAYDIYLNGRYSNPMGDNFFLEPYGTLSYTYVDQDGADEGNKTLAIETDSKSFDYTVGKVGLDLKKVIPHEKGKSTLTAGVSYTKIFDGADEENITGRFKGGSDFDILVAHKNEHSIGLNAKYALELESGVLLDVKGTYSVERDSHNGSAKNKNKGEWIIGAGVGYKF